MRTLRYPDTAVGLLWENQKRDENDDYERVDVEFSMAGHEFDHGVVHLWVDPVDHDGCILTLDLPTEMAEKLAQDLLAEVALIKAKEAQA